MMIDHIWSVLCSQAVIDVDSNSVSLQNVIEELQITETPKSGGVLPMHVELITLWVRSIPDQPAKGISRISYVFPSGKVAGQIEVSVDLVETERARTRIIFERLPVEENGRHYYQVELKNSDDDEWKLVSRIPLMVSFSPKNNEEQNKGEKPAGAEE